MSDNSTVERCGYPRCINAAPPPEEWASCFYDGSPCQTVDLVVLPAPSIVVSGVPSPFPPIIRGESETFGGRTEKAKPKKRNTKRRFVDWWTANGSPDESLDFLRKDAT